MGVFSLTTCESLYQWGELINRLSSFSFSDKQIEEIGNKVMHSMEIVLLHLTSSDVIELSHFLSRTYFLYPEFASTVIIDHINDYEMFLSKNIKKAFEIFDFNFLSIICRINYWGKYKPSALQKKVTKELVRIFPEKEFAQYISCSIPRYWRSIYEIMWLIRSADQCKARRIANLIELLSLDEVTTELWPTTSKDLYLLIYSIALGDEGLAKKYVHSKTHLIRELQLPFVEISPEDTVSLLENGATIHLLKDCHYKTIIEAIESLEKYNSDIAKRIVESNTYEFKNAIDEISEIAVRDDSFLKMLRLLETHYSDLFHKILSKINIGSVSNIVKRIRGTEKGSRKHIAMLNRILMLLSQNAPESVSKQLLAIKAKKI